MEHGKPGTTVTVSDMDLSDDAVVTAKVTVTDWNPRYVQWARSMGLEPGEARRLIRTFEFMLWSNRRLGEFARECGIPRHGVSMGWRLRTGEYDAWLDQRVDEMIANRGGPLVLMRTHYAHLIEWVGPCTECGEPLSTVEIGPPDPYAPGELLTLRDDNGHVLCMDCWSDEHLFSCSLCGTEDENTMRDHGVAVFDADAAEIAEAGIYRVKNRPYYMASVIGAGYLIDTAIERVGDLPAETCGHDFACGHMCRWCLKAHGIGDWTP